MASSFNHLNYNAHVRPIATHLPFSPDHNNNKLNNAISIKRIVLVNSINAIGALHAAALSTSHFLHPSQEIILTNFSAPTTTTTTTTAASATNATPTNENNKKKKYEGEVKHVEEVLADIRSLMKKHRHINNDINENNFDILSDTFLSYQYYYGGEAVFPLREDAVDGLLDRIKIVPDAAHLYNAESQQQQPPASVFAQDLFLFILNADVLPALEEQGRPNDPVHNLKEELRSAIVAHVGSFFDFIKAQTMFNSTDAQGPKGNIIVMADNRAREILLEEDLFFLEEETDEIVKTERKPRAAGAAAATTAQAQPPSPSSTRILDDLKKQANNNNNNNNNATEAKATFHLQWNICYTWVRAFSPPALDYSLTYYSVFNTWGNKNADPNNNNNNNHNHNNNLLCGKNYFSHSLLPLVCLHTVMGTVRHLPRTITRLTPVPVVPVDVALHTALLQFAHLCTDHMPQLQKKRQKQKQQGRKGGGEAPKNVWATSVVSIAMPELSMVWGMLVEYLVDYYGRYVKEIKEAVDHYYNDPDNNEKKGINWSKLFSDHPNLLTLLNRNDFKVFMVGNNMLLPPLERSREVQRRKKVLSLVEQLQSSQNNNNNNVEMKPLFQYSFRLLDQSIGQAQRLATLPNALRPPKANNRKERAAAAALAAIPATPYNTSPRAFHTATYGYLLEKLALQPQTAPLQQLVSLHAVDFDMYVRTIALAVLDQLAALFTSPAVITKKGAIFFPRPTRMPMANFIYDASVALPQHPIVSRRALGALDWFLRQGFQPNGRPLPVAPGMTPARLASLLGQPEVQRIAHNIAAEEGVAVTVVEQRARRMLLRIGDTLDHYKCCSVGLLVRYLFRNVYDRVQMNREAHMKMFRLFQLPRTHIVLVPHHRSYVDFIVMTYILVISCLPHPHIVSGEDFLKMGKFSEIMRASGAFFMRRSFRGDALYSLCFREYVKQLVRHQQTMEFFLEGTRSRTGKTMTPKIGILKFITDAFFEKGQNDVDDVLFVPVSISYDALLEGKMYARELLGVPKPPESVPNMIKAGLALRHAPHGSVNVFFGDPISLRGLQAKQVSATHPDTQNIFSYYCPAPYTPKEAPAVKAATSATAVAAKKSMTDIQKEKDKQLLYKTTSNTPAWMLTGLGWTITYHLQQNTMITPPALVAALVEAFEPFYVSRPSHNNNNNNNNNSNVTRVVHQGVPLKDLYAYFGWLKNKINQRHGKLRSDIQNSTSEEMVRVSLARLHRFIYVNEKEEVVFRRHAAPTLAASSRGGPEEGGSGSSSSSRGGEGDEREEALMARIGINISTNQLIHVFMDEAILAVVAHGYGTASSVADGDDHTNSGLYQAKHITNIHTNNNSNNNNNGASRQVRQDVLYNMAEMLHQLCSTEFPNYSKYSPCSFASWMSVTLHRIQQSEASNKNNNNSSNNNNNNNNNGPVISIPLNPLYYFSQQLLFPHIETMYVVVLSVEGLFAPLLAPPTATATTPAEVVIPIKEAVLATNKSYQAVYQATHFPANNNNNNNNNNNDNVLQDICIDYIVSASKEVVQHYYDALVEMALLKRTAGPKGPSFALAGATTSANNNNNNNDDKVAAAALRKNSGNGEENGLAPLRRLLAQLAPMRARTPADLTQEKKYIQKIVLEKYAKLMEGAKI